MSFELHPLEPFVAGKETLILAHGFLGDRHDWDFVRNQLPGYNLIAFNLPGHGEHQITESFSKDSFYNELEIKLLPFCDGPYSLLGYSMGGRVMLEFAVEKLLSNNHKPKKIILISANPSLNDEEKSARLASDRKLFENVLTQKETMQDFLIRWYQSPLFKTLTPEQIQCLIQKRKFSSPQQLQLAISNFSPALQPDLSSALDNFSCHYFYGEEDHKYASIAYRYKDNFKQIVPFKNCSHYLHFEQTQEFLAVIS